MKSNMEDNRAAFQIAYDGPAFASGEMSAGDLAQALGAFEELFEETNRIVYGTHCQVALKVQTGFRKGSFEISLVAIAQLVKDTKDFFISDSYKASKELLGVLGLGYLGNKVGLLQLLKWLAGKAIAKVLKTANGNFAVFKVDDTKMEVSKEVLDTFKNITIRKSIEIIITKPLERPGVEIFQSKEDSGSKTVEIKKEEALHYQCPVLGDEIINTVEVVQTLRFVTISFQEGSKWKFSDGTETFFATITSKQFLDQVECNEVAFSKGDYIKVRMRITQRETDTGIKTDREIIEVLGHQPAARQIKLPMEETKEDNNI
jgi:hypothetical protein